MSRFCAHRFPKHKEDQQFDRLFAFCGFAHEKATRKMLIKQTTCFQCCKLSVLNELRLVFTRFTAISFHHNLISSLFHLQTLTATSSNLPTFSRGFSLLRAILFFSSLKGSRINPKKRILS